MKYLILLFCFPFQLSALHVYFFPGLSVDSRVYSRLELNDSIEVTFLEWDMPDEGETMASYASRYRSQIDTTEAYAFVGLSLGGMVAIELAEIMKPAECVLISSAVCRDDLPGRYRVLESIPLYKVVNGKVLALTSMVLPYIIPIDHSGAHLYGDMVRQYDALMFQRQVHMLIHWDRQTTCINYVHIHGSKDKIIPYKKQAKIDFLIRGGGHKMLMTHAEEINLILKQVLIG